MPNTLAHLGIQGLVTRAVLRRSDIKWIFIGCTIPDVPWILLRLINRLAPEVHHYDARVYAIAQSSLVGCLLLCGALAAFSAAPRVVFLVLALNSFLHLGLDACQTKWGNGVHLIAPFSWKQLNLGLFWPESWPNYALMILGLGFFIYAWRRGIEPAVPLEFPRPAWGGVGAILLGAYFTVPILLSPGVVASDSHSIRTLRDRAARPGRYVEFDRNQYLHRAEGDVLRTPTGEELFVEGVPRGWSGGASVKARFVDEDTIVISDLHRHRVWFRDLGSYVGLILIGLFWHRSLRYSAVDKK